MPLKYINMGFIIGGGPYLEVLRAYSWLYVQGVTSGAALGTLYYIGDWA